ncbi:MAG TPA: flippase [Pyrinomonadaceae bacterium]|nr:flippase [Pyrinomonadaceae bacterium]
MTTKVVKGTIWMMVGLTVPIFFSLFATPLNTRLLGVESFGLFVLILLIPAYFTFGDFGMNIASTKFGAAAFAEGSPDKEARIVRTAAFIAILFSFPFAIGLAIFSPNIVAIFNVPEHLAAEASLALKLASVTYVINFLNGIFNTPELSRLRMDLNVMITSGFRLGGIIATPLVIYLGGGVIGAVAVALAASILTLTGHLIVSSRLLPELVGFTIDRESIRPMLRFGWSLVIAGVAAVLLVNLEKFVLTRATSVETLAYYSIAATFAAMLTLFSASMVQSLMPAFSQLQREQDRPALVALYSRGIRMTLFLLMPAVVVMVLGGKPFFTHWFGPDFGRESTGPFYITVAGIFFNVLAYFPYSAIMASGRSEIFARIYWIELVPYIGVVWVLSNRYGASGAALAWSIRVVFDAALLFYLASRMGVVFRGRKNFGFAILFSLMAVPIILLFAFDGLALIVLAAAIAAGSFYVWLVWAIMLDEDEIRMIREKLGQLLAKTGLASRFGRDNSEAE